MGVRSETLCQTLQMYFCAYLFCVLVEPLPFMGVFCLCRDSSLAQLRSCVFKPGLGKPLCLAESLKQVFSKELLKELCCNFFSAHDAQTEPAGMLCRGGLGDFGGWIRGWVLWSFLCSHPPLDVWLLLIPSVHRSFSRALLPLVYGNAFWNVDLDKISLSTSTQSTKILNYS